jgi:hypothetical protein
MNHIRAAFLASYEAIRPLIASDELDRRWDDASCLEGSTVRGLAGHLVRAGIAPFAYLEAAPPAAPPFPAPHYYATVLSRMTAADHAEVPERGEAVAGTGAADLRSTYDDAVDRAREILPSVDESRVMSVYMDVPLRFDDYLIVRIVEILVHTDDLAVSLDLDAPDAPSEAMDLAIDHLVAVARGQQGDRAVLIGLTRRERDGVDALRVFRAVPKS